MCPVIGSFNGVSVVPTPVGRQQPIFHEIPRGPSQYPTSPHLTSPHLTTPLALALHVYSLCLAAQEDTDMALQVYKNPIRTVDFFSVLTSSIDSAPLRTALAMAS